MFILGAVIVSTAVLLVAELWNGIWGALMALLVAGIAWALAIGGSLAWERHQHSLPSHVTVAAIQARYGAQLERLRAIARKPISYSSSSQPSELPSELEQAFVTEPAILEAAIVASHWPRMVYDAPGLGYPRGHWNFGSRSLAPGDSAVWRGYGHIARRRVDTIVYLEAVAAADGSVNMAQLTLSLDALEPAARQ